MRTVRCRSAILLGAAVVLSGSWSTAVAAVTLLGTNYQQDNPFSEYLCLWSDRNYPTACAPERVGANVHVFLRNDGASAVSVSDMTLAGYSLNDAIKLKDNNGHQTYSIYFRWDNPPQDILDTGEPVWFKCDPSTIPAGGSAHAVIRLRFVPKTPSLNVGVVTSAGTVNTTVAVESVTPQLASVGFSPDLRTVTLHWRRTGGAAPLTIRMDGNDVTAMTTTAGEPGLGFAVSRLTLTSPLAPMSYHVFQGVYGDGKTATGCLPAWVNPFVYASWAAFPTNDGDLNAARAWIDSAEDHGLNGLVMNMSSSGLADLLGTSAGKQYAADHNYGFVIDSPGKWNCTTPLMWFLDDEPDAEESNVANNFCGTGVKLPCGSNPMGILGRHFIAQAASLKAQYNAPTTINMNGAFKPSNYYNYGQLADVLMIDSYYQKRVMDSHYYFPNTKPLYEKPTVIYATSRAGTTAAEPNPFHMLLYSCEANPSGFPPWPFAPPQTKRIEAYYALAGGAKGMGYWWFKPSNASNGLGDQNDPNARALWKEIGLIGNEIKTVQPLLVSGHPVDIALQTGPNVWARGLASGTDTLMLFIVNDNHYNDQTFHSTPVANATVAATLPLWMRSSPTAFMVSAAGLSDVASQINGSQMQFNLGTLDVTRMIIVTTNPQLRATIQQRYQELAWPGVCVIAPELCTPQDTAPAITSQPQSKSTCTGSTATFIVAASGASPLSYQWQKAEADLDDGGHYSGTTTPQLTITGADENDAASYRCIVSNAHGDATSSPATLTVLECNTDCLQNPDFEDGFASGVGSHWTRFTRTGDVTCAEETTEKYTGARCQEVFSLDIANDGGVFQQFAASPGRSYTVSAWFKCYSPQGAGVAEGWLGVDPAGGTDPHSAGILWGSKPYDYWSQKSFTVAAQGNAITVFLRGRSVKPVGNNKVAYVWIDGVEVSAAPPTDSPPEALTANSIRWKWTDLSGEIGYRVRDTGGADKSGALPADTVEWTESDGILPNTPYTRRVHAIDDCGESSPSSGRTAYSLSVPPTPDSVSADNSSPALNEEIVWTTDTAFGPGTVQYYRYLWNQVSTATWTGSEPVWSSGTLTTSPTTSGTWYLHLRGHNGDDLPNGSYSYAVTVGSGGPDLDGDGDVDVEDFGRFQVCYTGPSVPQNDPACARARLDYDGDVDQLDFLIFLQCISGADVPADPSCLE